MLVAIIKSKTEEEIEMPPSLGRHTSTQICVHSEEDFC